MRKAIFPLMALVAALLFTACDDGETYGEKKDKERDAISAFIAKEGINVIDEARFEAQGKTTNVENNEYVYLTKSGVYMQIERKGEGEPLEEDKQVNILCKYIEYNIMDDAVQTRNDYNTRTYDKMSATRQGSSITASFVSGIMYNTYGASVPAGWLVPLLYINLGRPTSSEAIALVRIIVPHTQGHSYAASSVYPCFYTITYERER